MNIEYFWILTVIIFSVLIWYFCNSDIEHFNTFDNLFKTLRSLGFTENDLNKFTKDIQDGKNQDDCLDKIIRIASEKGFSYKEIFEKITE